MPKGPQPRFDLSKRNIEEINTSELPPDSKAEKIQTLLLEHNKLTSLPIIFSQKFSFLHVLYLNHNNLKTFPIEICGLRHLSKLHCENNQIETLPPEIGKLGNLKKFYMQNNELKELPDEISELFTLEVLDLHNNNLASLNPHLGACLKLHSLSIHNNPIVSPPFFIINKGLIYLMTYMRELRESLLQPCPKDEFIFKRNITFQSTDKSTSKRSINNKAITRTQSTKIAIQQANKALLGFEKEQRKNSGVFDRELQEEESTLDQNHLLYFLTQASFHAEQGRRDYMEDKAIAIPRLRQKKASTLLEEIANLFSKIGFFGVYDGHGGVRAAEYLTKHLHDNICNQEAFKQGDFETAIKVGFKKTDDAFLKLCRENYYMDGTTCCICMIIDNKLIAAHAGDSRAVLCRDKKAIRLTEDHKPDRVDELTRIEELGGEVIFRGNCFRVSGDLAMSRSFGDLRLKEPVPLVLSEPEIRIEELTPKDEFLIIATDGLWDVMTDQKAVEIVKRCQNVEEAAKKLVETALALGTMDNTTAVVIEFSWSLDFLTQNELEGKPPERKEKSKDSQTYSNYLEKGAPESISNLDRERSNSLSFRESYVPTMALRSKQDHKSIYLPTSDDAILIKVIIPILSATKLLKVNPNTLVKEIIIMMIRKHRFTESSKVFEIYLQRNGEETEISLEQNKTLEFYKVQSNDKILLKKKEGGTFLVSEDSPEEKFPEVLPSSEIVRQSQEHDTKRQQEELQGEDNLLETEAGVYKLVSSEWKIQDSKSKIGIYLNPTTKRYRIVALSSQEVYLLNAWILKEYPLKEPDVETFVPITTVTNGNINHWGFRFETSEQGTEFISKYKECQENQEKEEESTVNV